MAEKKAKRLSKIAKEFNVGIHTIVDFLQKKGMEVSSNPNTKISPETYDLLLKEYSSDIDLKKDSEKLNRIKSRSGNQSVSIEDLRNEEEEEEETDVNDDVLLIADTGVTSKTGKEEETPSGDQEQDTEPEKSDEPEQKEAETQKGQKETKDAPETGEDSKQSEQTREAEQSEEAEEAQDENDQDIRVVGKINLDSINEKTRPAKKSGAKKQKDKTTKTQELKQEAPSAQQKEHGEKSGAKTGQPEKKTPETEKTGQETKEAKQETSQPKETEARKPGKEEQDKQQKKQKQEKQEEQTTQAASSEKTKAPAESGKSETSEKQPKEEKPAEETKTDKDKSAQQSSKPVTEGKSKDDFLKTNVEKLSGPTVVGRIDLEQNKPRKKEGEKGKKPANGKESGQRPARKKRRRIKKEKPATQGQQSQSQDKKKQPDKEGGQGQKDKDKKVKVNKHPKAAKSAKDEKRKSSQRKRKRPVRKEVDEEDIQKQVKETLARLEERKKKSNKRTKRIKREQIQKRLKEEEEKQEEESNVLKVTEFISVNELAKMLNVHPNQVIAKCMELGMVVNINQRLDAETISVIADEYNYKTEFVGIDEEEPLEEEIEEEEGEGEFRPPIVTVMGHVDHGKTSLLDHIRSANVIAGEAGGITQHIGAYHVTIGDDKNITFIDTPGHQAFTSMRARGAQVTDIAIIVIAADDDIMPQTREAINHAEAAGVPMVFAINKIDKPNANPDRIKEQLANMNYLIEEWGGKYLSADISAKEGKNVEGLMELVLLQAELQELTAVKDKMAAGTVIEASLDKGRGYVATVLNQAGILKVGDYVLAGSYSGRIKAMFNERGKNINYVEPSYPAEILGLDGSPQPGDKFKVMENEKEAREIASKRQQLQREQTFRTQRPMTLDEIGRRIAIGNFQEVNVIIKGDFDGSIEALSDSLMKLTTQEVQVKIIHKGVGEISESDVMLAAASKAVIVGFNVRPSMGARKMADQQGIEIRMYSIIYDAINDMKDALEGMLDPEIKEEVIGTAEVRESFKISKVGTIAGCMVKEGKINRNNNVRVIRDGIVIYTGHLGSLKRYKEDVKEVVSGYECGLNIDRFNDIKVGDIIEAYKEKEVKRSLEDTK